MRLSSLCTLTWRSYISTSLLSALVARAGQDLKGTGLDYIESCRHVIAVHRRLGAHWAAISFGKEPRSGSWIACA